MPNEREQSLQQRRQDNKKILLSWVVVCGVLLSLIWGLVLTKIYFDREQLVEKVCAEVRARANTYAEQVQQTVMQIDQLSLVIKYEWERDASKLDLEEQFRKGVYQNAIYPVAINAQGIAVTGTRNLAKGTYMGDLDFFKKAKESSGSGLIINYPTLGRGGFANKKIIRFVRRFNKPDGSFDGIVLIAIESGSMTSFHDDSMLSQDDFISVRFADGPVMVSKVGGANDTAQNFYRENPRFTGNQGTLIESGEKFVDNDARIIGWKKLAAYPLITLAAVSTKNAMASYASTEKTYLGVAVVMSTLILLIAFSIASNQIRTTAHRRRESQIQKTFRMAVDGAHEAFYMVQPLYSDDGDLSHFVIEDCNERAAEITRRPRHALIGKSSLDLFDEKQRLYLHQFLRRVLAEGINEDEFHVLQGEPHLPGWFQRRAVRSVNGIAVTIRDISEARQQTESIEKMARTDALTGLPNRHWFNDYLPGALERAEKQGSRLSLLYIDLDNFKDINDALGHKAGDEVLCRVAEALRGAVRVTDHLTRLGGDEFTVIIENLDDGVDLNQIGRELIDVIGNLNALNVWKNFSVKASMGISTYPTDARDVDGLLQCADIAMYVAKSDGKGRYCHYDEKFSQKINDRITLEHALEQAIANDEFVMYYQPRARTSTGEFCSMEALLRWRHPERGLLSPLEFIALAEQTRLIIPLGELVVKKVCAQIVQWRDAGLPLQPVSVNVSALQLKDDRLRRLLRAAIDEQHISPSLIAIELTETSILDEEGSAPEELRLLRAMGIELQIDDFGTGYSSLSKLQSLDIDVVKIDQSFIRKLGKDPQSRALCEAIISIGRTLTITVVAEGVETPEQLRSLQEMGCDEVQGYLISRPVPAEDIPAMLLSGKFFEPA